MLKYWNLYSAAGNVEELLSISELIIQSIKMLNYWNLNNAVGKSIKELLLISELNY